MKLSIKYKLLSIPVLLYALIDVWFIKKFYDITIILGVSLLLMDLIPNTILLINEITKN